LQRQSEFERRRPRHTAHDGHAVVIGADGFRVFPIAVRLFSFTAELVGLLALLIA
jgi:hypothetical protein